MTDYDRNNSGALFKNDKQGIETRPDYTGPCEIDGKQFFMSAWIKQSKAGDTFMSLSFKPKGAGERHTAAPPQRNSAPAAEPEFNDEIPF